MKIGGSDSGGILDDLVEEAPEPAVEETSGNLLDDVLNQAAAAASASDEVHEPGFVFDEKVLAFMRDYRISKQDLGQTPMQLFQDLENPDRLPDADEEAILDDLLFKGRYEQTFSMGAKRKVVFTLTTFSSMVEQSFRRILQQRQKDDPDGFASLFNAAIIARSLVDFAGRKTCDFGADDKGFETEEALEDRIDFVLRLPTDILDTIGVRVNQFLRTTSGVMARSLSDF